MARPAALVILPPANHATLRSIIKKGTHKSRKITRARALLAVGAGKARLVVQTEADISANQYYCLKRRYLAVGLSEALEERPRSGQPSKVSAALEGQITRLACSEAPAGAARWTLSLLNETLVAFAYGPMISNETVRNFLKKANSSPG